MEWVKIPTGDGYEVPLMVGDAREGRASVLVLPALGTRASYYEAFGAALQERGLQVALFEPRGHGESALRPSRQSDWGFREWLTHDMPAAIAHLKALSPEAPLYLCGHSIGGHLSAALSALAPQSFDGIALIACGSPHFELYDPKTRRQIRFLTRIMPALHLAYGYFPGDRVGFAGREARTLMRDWRVLARENRYAAQGIDEDLEAGIAKFSGPVLNVRMSEDPLASEAAVRAVSERFRSARHASHVLDAEALGGRADHYGWCKRPAAVVRLLAGWIDSNP